jgi:hypothetical protein
MATKTNIRIGNNEFLLHIRKNYNCNVINPQLGKLVWIWIREHDENALQIQKDRPCELGDEFDALDGMGIPRKATQFEFNRNLLPEL